MKEQAKIFKALGDPVRLEIIRLLLDKELCVCHILSAFKVSQPTISHHLKALKYAGVVNDRREGKWIYYSLVPEAFAQARALLQEFTEKAVAQERGRTCG